MGALLATLGFEWKPPSGSRDGVETLSMPDEVSDEQLVAEALAHATRHLYREKIYRCDFYKGLDERIPEASLGEPAEKRSLWRINADHPLVYVLVEEKGQQPNHIMDDKYGSLVVYEDAQVEEGIDYLISLCSKAGYEIFNAPEEEEQEEEEEEEKKE